MRATRAMMLRDLVRLLRQRGRLLSSVVRPALWLVVFGAGFRDVLGVSIVPPYSTYVTYQDYMIPGLLGIVLLFNGMLSSLSLVYDRETGMMRAILTAPLPRWTLLLTKIISASIVSLVQAYAFLIFAVLFGSRLPLVGWLSLCPALLLCGAIMACIGLVLSVHVRQLENFAGTMNFVIFPMFFISSALFPLWKLRESGADWLWWAAQVNPFTHVVEVLRFAAYGKISPWDLGIAGLWGLASFLAAAHGYRLRVRPPQGPRDLATGTPRMGSRGT